MQENALNTVTPGLKNPAQDNQRIFRAILLTMSRPGTVTVLGNWAEPPTALYPATAAVCLTLADMDTPLWIGKNGPQDVQTYLRFHCGSPMVRKQEKASFAVILDGTDLPDLTLFNQGDLEYPDRSATVIIQVKTIEVGRGVKLTGPGIKNEMQIEVGGLHPDFWQDFQQNNLNFPLGLDVILATPTEIVSLPRTVQVEV